MGQLGSPLVGCWPLVWTKNEVLKYAGFFSPGFSFSNVGTWGGGEGETSLFYIGEAIEITLGNVLYT